MFSFNIKAKLTSFTSDVFNHSAHTVLSTASAGLAFGMVGAVVGLGIGIVEAALLYNDIIDTHYLTYATLAVSAASLLGAPILQSAFVSDVIEKSLNLAKPLYANNICSVII